MSMYGFYFVGSLLREAGWPRKQGFFGKLGYDSWIVDATIEQMIDWGAALGAGRPGLALQIITDMCRGRDWNAEPLDVEKFAEVARNHWHDVPRNTAPHDILTSISVAQVHGKSITAEQFKGDELRLALEKVLLDALLWGIASPDRFSTWYQDHLRQYEAALPRVRQAGVEVGPPTPLPEFLAHAEQIVRDCEQALGYRLPAVPLKLLDDARSLRRAVTEPPAT